MHRKLIDVIICNELSLHLVQNESEVYLCPWWDDMLYIFYIAYIYLGAGNKLEDLGWHTRM